MTLHLLCKTLWNAAAKEGSGHLTHETSQALILLWPLWLHGQGLHGRHHATRSLRLAMFFKASANAAALATVTSSDSVVMISCLSATSLPNNTRS